MPRKVMPYMYNLPQIPQRQNGAYMPTGSIATTQREEQQQQPSMDGLGLLKDAFGKQPYNPLSSEFASHDFVTPAWRGALEGGPFAAGLGPATAEGYAPGFTGGNLGFATGADGYASVFGDATLADAGLITEAGILGDGGLMGAGAEGYASVFGPESMGLLGETAAEGILPAMEFASTAPAVESGLLAGEALAADAALTGAAAEGGLGAALGLSGAGAVLWPLGIGLGLYGLGSAMDWW